MTVTSSTQDVSYATDGSTVVFPVPFYFIDDNHVFVDKIDANGTLVPLVLGTDYSVSGAGVESGGAVTTTVAYATGFHLHIYRIVPVTQETEYQQNDPFPAKSTEKALDKLTMIAQQTASAIENSIRYPSSEIGNDGVLPGANDRALKVVGFDALGNVVMLPMPTAIGAGDLKNEVWTGGTDYTPGVSTKVLLSRDYTSKANLGSVVMQGISQDPDSYRINAGYLEFLDGAGNPTAIPVDAQKIWCVGGTTLSLNRPALDSVTDENVTSDAAIKSSKLLYTPPGGDAVPRPVEDRLRETLFVSDFGAKFDGTDDTSAFQKALNELGSSGGRIMVPRGKKAYIAGTLTIPPNCSLVGPYQFTGSPGNNVAAPYGNMGALLLAPTATIRLSSGSGLEGLLIYRYGMVFPEATAGAFAGTAITLIGDDTSIYRSMILGFNQAVYGTGVQRPRIQDLYHDCLNGVWIDNCADISRIKDNHAWPFSTIGPSAPSSALTRPGSAYRLSTLGDWAQLCGLFSFGYFRGFSLESVNSVTLLGCGADGTGSYAGSYGFDLQAGCTDVRLIGCQAAAQATGYHFNNGVIPNLHSEMLGCAAWGNVDNGVLVDAGDVSIIGGTFRGATNGIAINNANSIVMIDKVRFNNNSSWPINCFVSTTNLILGKNDYGTLGVGNQAVNNNFGPVQISSATLMKLPPNDNVFYTVTGGTTIGGIAGGYNGRVVSLLFTAACTVGNSAASPNGISLDGGTNFNAVNGSTLTLLHNGSLWYEIGRKN
ncbi:hypothetical protein KTE52_25810 [Burkholderia multivorans]|uniref:Pectate lyase superfamily protein domain-containing protein n=1 Tax=Burkholderia multivorans TaxID=87883 RepID=A0AAP2MRG2_9BURK|nr:hypothetical protein [Burkholderia multivorans]MBU9359759.1 hypothetical protein [Burkholderia multivorans]